MAWHSPLAFLLLIPLVVAGVILYLLRKRKRPSLKFSSISAFKSLDRPLRSRLMWLPLALKFLALVLAVVALARPQRADVKVKKNVEGIDIMIALDISDSMLIEDMEPVNRMESSKVTIKQFIQGRVSDRIGLVVFSGESYTRVPPTLDYPLLLQSVEEVEPSRNIKMGTALGVSLANAVARLKDSTAKSRVVVFLTDGENNSGTIDPDTALEIAKGYGIKVYTIGVGKDGETRIPVYVTDPFGNKVKRYQPFYSAVNDELLQKMAAETGGIYFRAASRDSLEEVFSSIDSLEKAKIDVNQFTKYAELFPPYLAAGVLLYLLSLLLSRSLLRRLP